MASVHQPSHMYIPAPAQSSYSNPMDKINESLMLLAEVRARKREEEREKENQQYMAAIEYARDAAASEGKNILRWFGDNPEFARVYLRRLGKDEAEIDQILDQWKTMPDTFQESYYKDARQLYLDEKSLPGLENEILELNQAAENANRLAEEARVQQVGEYVKQMMAGNLPQAPLDPGMAQSAPSPGAPVPPGQAGQATGGGGGGAGPLSNVNLPPEIAERAMQELQGTSGFMQLPQNPSKRDDLVHFFAFDAAKRGKEDPQEILRYVLGNIAGGIDGELSEKDMRYIKNRLGEILDTEYYTKFQNMSREQYETVRSWAPPMGEDKYEARDKAFAAYNQARESGDPQDIARATTEMHHYMRFYDPDSEQGQAEIQSINERLNALNRENDAYLTEDNKLFFANEEAMATLRQESIPEEEYPLKPENLGLQPRKGVNPRGAEKAVEATRKKQEEINKLLDQMGRVQPIELENKYKEYIQTRDRMLRLHEKRIDDYRDTQTRMEGLRNALQEPSTLVAMSLFDPTLANLASQMVYAGSQREGREHELELVNRQVEHEARERQRPLTEAERLANDKTRAETARIWSEVSKNLQDVTSGKLDDVDKFTIRTLDTFTQLQTFVDKYGLEWKELSRSNIPKPLYDSLAESAKILNIPFSEEMLRESFMRLEKRNGLSSFFRWASGSGYRVPEAGEYTEREREDSGESTSEEDAGLVQKYGNNKTGFSPDYSYGSGP